jgi:hypothetical protein
MNNDQNAVTACDKADGMRGRLAQFSPHFNYEAPEDFEPEGYNVEAFELSINDLLICRISVPRQSIGRTVHRPAYVILQAVHWEEYGSHFVDWKRYGDLHRTYGSLNRAIGAAIGELFADDLNLCDQAEEEAL